MNTLKEPETVAKIQRFFGVRRVEEGSSDKRGYTLENKFWYYLFMFGTALGDETFYSAFIPFWFWNIDGAVGRRVVLVWAIVMYIGYQGYNPMAQTRTPVVQLQNKWALEYGMPSTHAMVGVSIPFSVVLFTMNRYQYDLFTGLCLAVVWCSLICVSRLYLGMHTVLDIIVGLALAVFLMFPLVPLVDYLDNYFLTSPTAPFLIIVASILMVVYYPYSEKWTPTRGDTAMILSVCVGVQTGAWLNYQTGYMILTDLPPPYVIMWPSYSMLGCMILRTLIGFVSVILTRQVFKSITYHSLCALLKEDVNSLKKSENTLQNKHKTFVELSVKYVYCAMIGFNTLYVLPQLFKFLRIERPTFFTEI